MFLKKWSSKIKKYYENNKEMLRGQAQSSWRNLSEDEEKYKKENTEEIDVRICVKKIKQLK